MYPGMDAAGVIDELGSETDSRLKGGDRVIAFVIEISRTHPPIYILRGGVPSFDTADLRALAIMRDTFGDRHPQVAQVRRLLERLTSQLGEADRRANQRRQARRAPVQPAIDYTPYDDLIARLERAIDARLMLRFRHRSGVALSNRAGPRRAQPVPTVV
jgi:hypothetical protein